MVVMEALAAGWKGAGTKDPWIDEREMKVSNAIAIIRPSRGLAYCKIICKMKENGIRKTITCSRRY